MAETSPAENKPTLTMSPAAAVRQSPLRVTYPMEPGVHTLELRDFDLYYTIAQSYDFSQPTFYQSVLDDIVATIGIVRASWPILFGGPTPANGDLHIPEAAQLCRGIFNLNLRQEAILGLLLNLCGVSNSFIFRHVITIYSPPTDNQVLRYLLWEILQAQKDIAKDQTARADIPGLQRIMRQGFTIQRIAPHSRIATQVLLSLAPHIAAVVTEMWEMLINMQSSIRAFIDYTYRAHLDPTLLSLANHSGVVLSFRPDDMNYFTHIQPQQITGTSIVQASAHYEVFKRFVRDRSNITRTFYAFGIDIVNIIMPAIDGVFKVFNILQLPVAQNQGSAPADQRRSRIIENTYATQLFKNLFSIINGLYNLCEPRLARAAVNDRLTNRPNAQQRASLVLNVGSDYIDSSPAIIGAVRPNPLTGSITIINHHTVTPYLGDYAILRARRNDQDNYVFDVIPEMYWDERLPQPPTTPIFDIQTALDYDICFNGEVNHANGNADIPSVIMTLQSYAYMSARAYPIGSNVPTTGATLGTVAYCQYLQDRAFMMNVYMSSTPMGFVTDVAAMTPRLLTIVDYTNAQDIALAIRDIAKVAPMAATIAAAGLYATTQQPQSLLDIAARLAYGWLCTAVAQICPDMRDVYIAWAQTHWVEITNILLANYYHEVVESIAGQVQH